MPIFLRRLANAALFMGLGLVLAAFLHPAQSQEIRIRGNDQWAGKVVKDSDHVDNMVMSRLHNAPTVGKQAPRMLVTEASTGKPYFLSDLCKTKPVVLFFGSYSCSCTQEAAHPVRKLSEKYGDRLLFLLVYIREAHPGNGFSTKKIREEHAVQDVNLFPNRASLALRFGKESQFRFPIFVDSMDDLQAFQWGAWPSRLFVVDRENKVVYADQQGPWFVMPTDDFKIPLPGVPEPIRNLPGYSLESLEQFLSKYSTANR